MSNSLSRSRTAAFLRQAGRCYYCAVPMWDDDVAAFARQYGLSQRAARSLQCTAEHLHPKCDGGADSRDNIAAACWHCNRARHRGRKTAPSPDAYRQHVRRRLARGSWHLAQVLQCGLVQLRE